MSNTNPDATNPDHYKRLDPEPIVVIERWDLGFHLGNALKYIARAGRKASETLVDDLRKARWYVNRRLVEVAPDAEAITTSITFTETAARLERALVDLEAAERSAEQWRITARAVAHRLRSLRGIDDPECARIIDEDQPLVGAPRG